jgi:hypothetical protein
MTPKTDQSTLIGTLLAVSASNYFLILLAMAVLPAQFAAGVTRCTLDRHSAGELLDVLAVAGILLGGPVTLILSLVAILGKQLRWAGAVLLLTLAALPVSLFLWHRIELSAERQSPGHREKCRDRVAHEPKRRGKPVFNWDSGAADAGIAPPAQ